MPYSVDFSEGCLIRDQKRDVTAQFFFINPRSWGRKDPDAVKAQADVTADALNVHEATGLTPSQLQARVADLEAALSLMYEFHQPMAWGSETNKREALEEARKALGVEE